MATAPSIFSVLLDLDGLMFPASSCTTVRLSTIHARTGFPAVIEQHIKEQPSIAVTYFLPDNKKAGGRYVTVSGNVRKLDGTSHQIIMADGTGIPIDDVRFIEGGLFDAYKQ